MIDSGFPERSSAPNAQPAETITEFPFFSFILGDLHAHVLSLPFTVAGPRRWRSTFSSRHFAASGVGPTG